MSQPEERAGVDSVVISTNDGTPIAVAMHLEDAVWVKTVNDPEFPELMETLGFNKRDLPKLETLKIPQ